MNSRWHKSHALPRNATLRERIAWHLEHQKQCACRPIPPKLMAQVGRKSTEAAEIDPRFAPVVDAFAGDRQVTYGGKGFGSTGSR